MEKKYMRFIDIQHYLGCSRAKIQSLIEQGMPCIQEKKHASYLFVKSEVDTWLKQKQKGAE